MPKVSILGEVFAVWVDAVEVNLEIRLLSGLVLAARLGTRKWPHLGVHNLVAFEAVLARETAATD